MNLMNNGQMDRGNENPTQHTVCLDDSGKPRKNPSQVGRHRDLNQGSSECESRALPRSHLARFIIFLFLYICKYVIFSQSRPLHDVSLGTLFFKSFFIILS